LARQVCYEDCALLSEKFKAGLAATGVPWLARWTEIRATGTAMLLTASTRRTPASPGQGLVLCVKDTGTQMVQNEGHYSNIVLQTWFLVKVVPTGVLNKAVRQRMALYQQQTRYPCDVKQQ